MDIAGRRLSTQAKHVDLPRMSAAMGEGEEKNRNGGQRKGYHFVERTILSCGLFQDMPHLGCCEKTRPQRLIFDLLGKFLDHAHRLGIGLTC
jgi:hypothetical protein